jgi:hypothetical protein
MSVMKMGGMKRFSRVNSRRQLRADGPAGKGGIVIVC